MTPPQPSHRSVDRYWVVLLSAFAALRLWRIVGRPIARFADTAGYLEFELWGSNRFWPVTFVYQLVRSDQIRVVAHVAVATASWGFLARVLTEPLHRRRRWVPLLVLLVGLTDPASRFDLTILSESLGISFAVAAIAAWVLWLRSGDGRSAALVIVTTALFGMTRAAQVPVLILVTAAALLHWWLGDRTRAQSMVATSLVFISIWGVFLVNTNRSMSELNLYSVLAERVVPDAQGLDWFATQGMPVTAAMAESSGYLHPEDLPPELASYVDLPIGQTPPALMLAGGLELARWVRSSGWSTYVRYLVAHPGETIALLSARADYVLDPVAGDLLPLQVRGLVPQWVLLPWQWCVVTVLAAAIVVRRRRQDAATTVSLALLALGVVWFGIVALGSGIEHPRHAVTLAVVLRVAAAAAVVGALIKADQLHSADD